MAQWLRLCLPVQGVPGASQVVLVVKTLSANAGDIRDPVRSMSQEDPWEVGMATHFNILAWSIPVDRGAWLTTYG